MVSKEPPLDRHSGIIIVSESDLVCSALPVLPSDAHSCYSCPPAPASASPTRLEEEDLPSYLARTRASERASKCRRRRPPARHAPCNETDPPDDDGGGGGGDDDFLCFHEHLTSYEEAVDARTCARRPP